VSCAGPACIRNTAGAPGALGSKDDCIGDAIKRHGPPCVSRQRRRVERSTEDEGVLKLEFDNRWELVESMGGLDVRVTPADGNPVFDALLVSGCREYEDGDLDNAALVQVERLDVHKNSVVACVLITTPDGRVDRHVRTFKTMTADLLALGDWLSG
jgi:hypothetical protein